MQQNKTDELPVARQATTVDRIWTAANATLLIGAAGSFVSLFFISPEMKTALNVVLADVCAVALAGISDSLQAKMKDIESEWTSTENTMLRRAGETPNVPQMMPAAADLNRFSL